jgi:hypothetical protein
MLRHKIARLLAKFFGRRGRETPQMALSLTLPKRFFKSRRGPCTKLSPDTCMIFWPCLTASNERHEMSDLMNYRYLVMHYLDWVA